MNYYKQMTDEQLIKKLREGDSGIIDYLMDKYKNTVRKEANAMYLLGGENDDLIQEGMIGLYKAVRDYDSGRDAGFHTFAQLCITRQMYTAVQASGRKKHSPLNYYTSLYADAYETGGEEAVSRLSEQLASESYEGKNPEEMMIESEDAKRLEQEIETTLSPFERQVMELCLTGMGYIEIARILGRTEKATDNALQRIRAKLRKYAGKE